MAVVHLPDELLVEIIRRLPVKSLLRFRCVSKSWYSLISNPQFITLHRNHNLNNPLMVLERETIGPSTLHFDNDAFDLLSDLEFPVRKLYGYYRIVGACRGLICVAYNLADLEKELPRYELFLWNPSIRKILCLSAPEIPCKQYQVEYGFGFHSKSNDYKVVRIVYCREGKECKKVNGFGKVTRPQAELYELSTGAWRGISAVVPPYNLVDFSALANINGSMHWIAINLTPIRVEFYGLIVAFDLSEEVFKEIMLPKALAFKSPVQMSIAAYGESLSLFHTCMDHFDSNFCSVWVMEKYGMVSSWTKVFNIELSQGVRAVLGSRKNGELLVVTGEGKLVSYDPDDGQVKDTGIREHIICPFSVNTYSESLILLDRGYGGFNYDCPWFARRG